MNNNKIIYSLNVKDIQTVANKELRRDLSPREIKKILNTIGEKINWYDAIADSVNETIIHKNN